MPNLSLSENLIKQIDNNSSDNVQISKAACGSNFICLVCNKVFSLKSNLTRHMKSFHPDFSPPNNLSEQNDIICQMCSKAFSNKSNLTRHMKNVHPDFSLPTQTESQNFKCDVCDRKFSREKNLNYHKRKEHMCESNLCLNVVCSVCHANIKKSEIIAHFTNNHDIQIQTNQLNFSSFDDCMEWMAKMERNTKEKFIRFGKKGQTYYFKCHRSGHFKPRGKGIRQLKQYGSNKIDAYCPASIKVHHTEGGGMCSYFYKHTCGSQK